MLRGHVNRERIGLAAGIAALAAAALLSAGCGGGALSLDPVASAATKTQNAGAARVKYSMTLSAQGKSFALDGKGVIDGTNADLTFDLGSMLSRMSMPSSALGGASRAQLAHASMEEVLIKQGTEYLLYIRFPSFLAAQIPGGKQWVEMDLSALGTIHGVNFSQLMSSSQLNPSDMLGMLRSEGGKVTKLGAATIDGVATTHYGVKIDVSTELKSNGLTSPLFRQAVAKMPTVPVDVWIDKDNLVRRMSVAISMPTGHRSVGMRMSIDFSDYGAGAAVVAPPSDSVYDITSLIASGSGSGSGG